MTHATWREYSKNNDHIMGNKDCGRVKGEGRMTLQQMRYFVAVAAAGSISEAAKELYAAQSGVSQAVSAVEKYYGVKAFVRTSRGVTLTSEGKELLIEFKGILNRLYYLDEKYGPHKKQEASLSIAAQHHICGLDSFMALLDEMKAEEYHMSFHECRTSEVMEQVEKGLADLGLIFFAEPSKSQMVQELRSKGMIFNHMAYQRAHVYLWEGHPLAGQKEICLESLVDYPFITYDRVVNANPAYTELVVPYYMIHKTISVSDRAAAYSIMRCSQGFAVGSGCRSLDPAYKDIRAIPIENGVSLEIGWILRSSYVLPEAAERFIGMMEELEIRQNII